MVKKLLVFIVLLMFCHSVYATHNRAGYIKYSWLSGFTYSVTIITYTKESSYAADRPSLPINWGDFKSPQLDTQTIARTNGGGNGVYLGNDIKYNQYTASHTFPGFGKYVLSMADPNRIAGILNLAGGNSVGYYFYIEDTLDIPDPQYLLGHNNSPILSKDPIDFAEVGQVFIYNPNAWDPDDDSLTFKFVEPKESGTLPVPGYIQPNQVQPVTGNPTFTINSNTGEVVWNAPQTCGIYNIAILMTEWRRVKGGPIYATDVGTTELDMEIIVTCAADKRPNIASINDTCIIAGATLKINVKATDPDLIQSDTLTATGGPFIAPPASNIATFATTPGNPATGLFTWNTTCDHISSQPYQVTFTAVDNYPVTPLADVLSWRIKVVAPPPQNLTAKAAGNSIILNWSNPYPCSTIAKFLGFSVWRREGCIPIPLDTCVTGLPGMGFTEIADSLFSYTYTDNNVQRGKGYSYIILADFGTLNGFPQEEVNAVESLPSNEACAALKKDVPVITNVSILKTSADSGQVFVGWSKPAPLDLDTVQNPAPYKYVICRSAGFKGGPFTRIDSIPANTFYQLVDTTYIDSLKNGNNMVNTIANPWSYKILFYSNGNYVGETDTASSVFLTIASASRRLNLSWNENVPWENSSYIIYKKDKSGNWDSIAVTSSMSYTDTHLKNDSTYCYYVKSIGSYSATGFIDPIINLSQRVCSVPIDTVGPCPPVLAVMNNCTNQNFALGPNVNQLIWTKAPTSCAADLLRYKIYYASKSTAPFQLLDSSHLLNDTTFTHYLNETVAGCYAVAGVDSDNNEGAKSNVVCEDNCPLYELPNVFTPNGDDKNDLFHPILPYRYIDRVDMKIFDSWGVLVFQTSDPIINWDGTKMGTREVLPQGTYYYVCDVYESNPGGDLKSNKPLSGFIHLFR